MINEPGTGQRSGIDPEHGLQRGGINMYIMDDGIRLNAALEMPEERADKLPLVIIIHGFTGHMEEEHLLAVAGALRSLGCATLRVDMYGHGHSDGKFRDHTLYKWLTNALTVIDYAWGLDFVSDLYLCGHSQGGLTVMLAGALKHDVIKGVIPLSPAAMIPALARAGKLLGTDFDPDQIPEELTVWGDFRLGGNYVRVAQTIHVEEAVDRYDGPVLIVQGDRDGPDLQQSAYDAAARYRNCRLKVIPGADHCYTQHRELLAAAVKDWMQEQLQA